MKKLAAKVADYKQRLEKGQTSEIKPDHVQKVLAKLEKKQVDLKARFDAETDPGERERLTGKLGIAREQIARARWLLDELD
ncbi:hypothetical protein EJA01_03885 [Rhodovulum iodosum]|uniref:hypothetical protein n=1 Tax=Rhodovulum iodosum TaxID=68291 RepID=UPI000F6730FA|nr:hypothetical protein [Rhodovulum robiginosum]RSK37792.1 hypothetical protein EJA01_03885 [Rhodovulum robiginosum]